MNLKDDKTTLTIYLEGATITDITSFYRQVNAQLMQDEDWQLGENLDAFDDLLYGGYSKWKDYDQLEIIWTDIAVSERGLGRETTKTYYESKLGENSPYNQDLAREKIKRLEAGKGQTYFDILMEIIESHRDKVILVKR
ncbi:barstar family protein [Sphingobacterium arenae]|uniref:Barstar family protein n=1 Tax=Sphingobacterium arenae TaxID=1280598 RepID=A0ABR7Y408_9SPHI|nr:barstar family protein [Sphingobacterium arenae]MBD1426038.1 barstar family protein [Sphingobacterium arenae]